MNSQPLMIISGPEANVRQALSRSGFVRDGSNRTSYRLELDTPSGVYTFRVPFEESGGELTLKGEAAYFEGLSDSEVPEPLRVAVLHLWHTLRRRAASPHSRRYTPNPSDWEPSSPVRTRPLEKADNGSMVQDFADMKRLGHDMKRMKTEQELEAEGYVNDPIQHR